MGQTALSRWGGGRKNGLRLRDGLEPEGSHPGQLFQGIQSPRREPSITWTKSTAVLDYTVPSRQVAKVLELQLQHQSFQ